MLNLFFSTALAALCIAVLIRLLEDNPRKPPHPYIIAYWVTLMLKNIADMLRN